MRALINLFVIYRVESFIEHQDACSMGRIGSENYLQPPPACLSRTASSPSPSRDTNLSVPPWAAGTDAAPFPATPIFLSIAATTKNKFRPPPNLELQLRTTDEGDRSTQLQLSIGSSEIINQRIETTGERLREESREQMGIALAEKCYAEEARREARRQIEVAEQELSDVKRIRRCAEAELERARELKEEAAKEMKTAVLRMSCHSCKHNLELQAQYYYCYKTSNICRTGNTQDR